MKKQITSLLIVVCAIQSVALAVKHRVLIAHEDALTVIESDGIVGWQMPWRGSHDAHVDSDGFYYAIRDQTQVCKIDPVTKKIVWSYDSQVSNGNTGKSVEVHSFQPLAGGAMMVAESGVGRIIEVDTEGKLLKEIKLVVNKPDPHRDTRLARKLDNGNYLVAHEGDGCAREYSGETGEVIWEFQVPLARGRRPADGHGLDAYGTQLFSALRLPNGNTLIGGGNNHTVLEVTPDQQIVWSLDQYQLDGIGLAWVTTVQRLASGHYLIGNCHAGSHNPQLIEIDPATKKAVWQLNQYDIIGNNASNAILLD